MQLFYSAKLQQYHEVHFVTKREILDEEGVGGGK